MRKAGPDRRQHHDYRQSAPEKTAGRLYRFGSYNQDPVTTPMIIEPPHRRVQRKKQNVIDTPRSVRKKAVRSIFRRRTDLVRLDIDLRVASGEPKTVSCLRRLSFPPERQTRDRLWLAAEKPHLLGNCSPPIGQKIKHQSHSDDTQSKQSFHRFINQYKSQRPARQHQIDQRR